MWSKAIFQPVKDTQCEKSHRQRPAWELGITRAGAPGHIGLREVGSMRRIIAATFFVLFANVNYENSTNILTVQVAFAQVDSRGALANLISDLQAGTVKWDFIAPQLAQSILA